MQLSLHSIGYSLTGLGFVVFTALILAGLRRVSGSALLMVATSVSALWAARLAVLGTDVDFGSPTLFLLELAHTGVWLVFLSTLMRGALAGDRVWLVRFGGVLLFAGFLVLGLAQEIAARYFGADTDGAAGVLVIGALLTALCGLVVIEQLYRNSRDVQRRSLKYLCLGLGTLFAYDVFLYSSAILIGEISPQIWGARGFVVAMGVPLIAVSAHRASRSTMNLFVSRQVVFHGATVVAGGVYLTVIGFVAYYLRVVGGDWAPAAQVVLVSGALIVFGILLASERVRARARVFIIKHFYENKYDYREEWLRLIDTLTSTHGSIPLKRRAIKALAQIVGAKAGLLWLANADDDYRCVASWSTTAQGVRLGGDTPMIRFLRDTGWVVERAEYERDPAVYGNLDCGDVSIGGKAFEFIIPLLHDDRLVGFIALSDFTTVPRLNFEDRDLLKTAGKQIASYIAQELATEQLAEHRQFEAFNRLTAYMMHDLKNLIAQQSLVVENARKHKGNPEFVEDAIETVRSGVARMRRVLDYLRQGTESRSLRRLEVGQLVMEAVSQCADRLPVPASDVGERRLWVRGDRDRLLMALIHAVRNAQDATRDDGRIDISVAPADEVIEIRIVDTGRGMDPEFVQDRLFKPFDSTKGTTGMGIGAYQIQETARSLGGGVEVDSEPGRGTAVIIRLPRVADTGSSGVRERPADPGTAGDV